MAFSSEASGTSFGFLLVETKSAGKSAHGNSASLSAVWPLAYRKLLEAGRCYSKHIRIGAKHH